MESTCLEYRSYTVYDIAYAHVHHTSVNRYLKEVEVRLGCTSILDHLTNCVPYL